MPIRSDDVVRVTAQLNESDVSLGRVVFLPPHNVCHLLGEYKRRPLPFESHFLLKISEEMSKVNVEEVANFREHDIAIMAITNSEVIRCDTVARRALDESLRKTCNFQTKHYTL